MASSNIEPAPAPVPERPIAGFTPRVWSWAFYDLANTVFSALFVSANFPLLISEFLQGSKFQIGMAVSGASLLSAVSVPFLGSMSDQLGRRVPFLIVLTITCCLLTPLSPFMPLALALFAGGAAMYCYYTGLALYDAILPDIADERTQGKVSGLGVGVGYAGTILALAAQYPLIQIFGDGTIETLRASNIMIGLLFLIFAMPLFFIHRERGSGHRIEFGQAMRDSFGRVAQGARAADRSLWFFIAASFFIVNGVMTIIAFFLIFGRDVLGISQGMLYGIYAVLALSALVGGLIGGFLTDRLRPRPVLFAACFGWIAVIIWMMFIQSVWAFVVAGSAGGVFLSWVWTAQRPLLVRLADPERMGETFGFLGIANRASAMLGPAVFGWLSDRYGYNAGLFALIFFFVAGIVLLTFVPSRAARVAPGEPAQA